MPPAGSAPPRALLRSFDAIATAVLPPGDTVGPGAANAAAALQRSWADMQPRARSALAAMLGVVEAAALLRTGRPLRVLSPERRTALCDHLEIRASTVPRTAFLGVKTLVLVLAAADPAVERSIGTAAWPPNLLRNRGR